ACNSSEKSTGEALPQQVKAASVAFHNSVDEIRGFGSLSFQRKIDLTAASDAVLETLLVREGDPVRKGETAILLKNPQINLAVRRAQNGYAQAEAALELARARLIRGEFQAETRLLENEKAEEELALVWLALDEERRKQAKEEILYSAGGISEEKILESRFSLKTGEERAHLMEKELDLRRIGLRPIDLIASGITPPEDEAELRRALICLYTSDLMAEFRAAGAFLDAAARELESTRLLESELTVTAPLNGIVGARYFEEGERLKREDKILTVIDTESLYAVFPVSESDSLKLARGMNANVSLDGTGGTYDGLVDLVYPQGDSQSFSFLVRVLIPSSEGLLKPGMFARISIPLKTPQGMLVIPETALISKKENQAKVFTIQGNHLRERQVIFGRILGDEREIISGLEKGEAVALRPDAALRDGAYVSVLE
ncbi:MAG: efflux RND transporter periplasmic adaptor subunit, partial [Treponema sp.]|nr:efflux RND transporter periplasmic adaptor subunit [Treponema sp.]